jgi:hypothetical protein
MNRIHLEPVTPRAARAMGFFLALIALACEELQDAAEPLEAVADDPCLAPDLAYDVCALELGLSFFATVLADTAGQPDADPDLVATLRELAALDFSSCASPDTARYDACRPVCFGLSWIQHALQVLCVYATACEAHGALAMVAWQSIRAMALLVEGVVPMELQPLDDVDRYIDEHLDYAAACEDGDTEAPFLPA